MRPNKSSRPEESASKSTARPSKVTLTKEEELKLDLEFKKMCKGVEEAFKGGADLSKKETP
jgi:hypothetical protein